MFGIAQMDSGALEHCCMTMQASEPDIRPQVLSRLRVLVVDDDLVNLEVASFLLEQWGVEPVLAVDGADAVRLFSDDSDFDLVLMDLQMPVMDGLAASRAIRGLEPARPGQRVPIVACTSAVVVDDGAELGQHGLDAVLAKPYSVYDLAACLARWCPTKFQSN